MAPKGFTKGKMYDLNINDITPDTLQPRKYFDQLAMDELKVSIEKHGVLQPVLVRGGDDGKFLVVSGERRYQAALAAGLSTIPALLTDGDPVEISIVENLLREDLTAIEEAEAIESLRAAHSYQLSDLSQVLGKAESTLSEILSLNKLPDPVKNDCRNDPKAARGVLAEISKQHTPEKMQALYEKYKQSGLTRGEIRGKTRTAKPPTEEAPVDFSFVANCIKRLDALETEKVDPSQHDALVETLEKLRSSAYQKLKVLKVQAAPS
jgi:ParB family transcriptional regulator, chromosome partitioning protein